MQVEFVSHELQVTTPYTNVQACLVVCVAVCIAVYVAVCDAVHE